MAKGLKVTFVNGKEKIIPESQFKNSIIQANGMHDENVITHFLKMGYTFYNFDLVLMAEPIEVEE